MNHLIAHTLKYLLATLLMWVACYLSSVHLTIGSLAILGFTLALLEWQYKVWQVKQMTLQMQEIVRHSRVTPR